MHSRPLAPGDFDRMRSSLVKFDRQYWRSTAKVLDNIEADHGWHPENAFEALEDKIRHNLPHSDYDETGLVGRDDEVKRICAALKRRRDPVITLCGEGGIGKTALAVEVAYQLLDDPEEPFDLILWASLKSERLTGTGVLEIKNNASDLVGVAQALGEGARSDFSGGVQQLATVIDGFKPLIIIDNLETINGEDFLELYEGLPDDASFLITSREGIGQVERRIDVKPLGESDALYLLNQLVRYRNVPSLRRVSGDSRKVIVSKLRCSPLAIRWFILATEAGHDPLNSIRHQDELLNYCVRSVYENLSPAATEMFIAMDALRRPVTQDDLVVLLGKAVSEVGSAVRELIRGSLVRSWLTGDTAMATMIALTETARQFTATVVPRDHPVRTKVQENETVFLREEERRSVEAGRRSLGPNVVRVRYETDAPSAQLLRRALSASRSKDYEVAFTLIDEAKTLNPEFWEVHRVEAFVHSANGNKLAARESYLNSYDLAETEEHKAVVAYYYAGHMARAMREPELAVPYATEAHRVLRLPDTGYNLGASLVWQEKFDEGIEYLETALVDAEGRLRLIVLTALSDAYCRRAEVALTEARNPIQAAYDAIAAFELASDELNRGASDRRLRDTATEASISAMRYLFQCAGYGESVDSTPDFFDKLTTRLVQLRPSDKWPSLLEVIKRHASAHADSYPLARLIKAAGDVADGVTIDETKRLHGTIYSLLGSYGFITCPILSERVYFHKSGLAAGLFYSRLNVGVPVAFSLTTQDDRTRAVEVELEPSL
ncbi:NB-ARC domain protein [Arthrobacter saudimassiliensis]|uniref:NB-ARC domain protein n=1 Tax=Arthrobacter saudimassiliensis TaxID=1461584 RepID=A0A078MPU1_9MICC|nr:NB-ARC domain protein [Arthrobacter saudimassiliensis]